MVAETQQGDYRIFRDPIQREITKRRLVDLAHAAHGKDAVLFLDNSARFLSNFFPTLWQTHYGNEPKPRILNIKIGNETGVALSDHSAYQWKEPATIENLIPKLDSVERLREIYGQGNVDRLQRALKSDRPEDRLVVDDLSHSGRTLRIVKHLMWLLDPVNTYRYFTLIENNSLEAFYRPKKGFVTPWKLRKKPTDESDPKSFFVSSHTDERLSRQRRLRQELEMLAASK